ncbi:hypothetical protein L1987_59580 [Smallanthus sonchifolius]|uniref:Uncharacterized protein n=1 Tax=Smallanthus sonchifolius TaxID=185202 RepID=A0ACB9D5Q3_9ASTR|nr:hypothetical protein L1987_59580 [Smallanthus sonchifolius]
MWAFRHAERNIAETGLNLMLEMLKNFQDGMLLDSICSDSNASADQLMVELICGETVKRNEKNRWRVGSGRKWGLVDDQKNNHANTSRARNRDLDWERAVAEAKVWGENWRDRKRTNTIGDGSFDAANV